MSSTYSRRDHDRRGDLTARARIRDTALQMFADHGYVGTTIRGIAQAAGVSSALVQHHFGNKESLRGVCDRYTIDFIRDQLAEAVTADGVGQPQYLDAVYRDAALPMRYLVQVMVDDSPSAASLFDELVELTTQYLPELPDAPEDARRTRAAVLNSMHLGVLMMRGQLSRVLGVDILSAEGFTVIGAAMLEVLDPDVTGPATHQLAHDGLARYRVASQPTSPSH
jgi:AcrR family transcriptional regulator